MHRATSVLGTVPIARALPRIIFLTLVLILLASNPIDSAPAMQSETQIQFHLHRHQVSIWDHENKTHVFIFNGTDRIVGSDVLLPFESLSTQEIAKCDGYYACRLVDGHFVTGYDYVHPDNIDFDVLLYRERQTKKESDSVCENGGRTAYVYLSCNTHYNPPFHRHVSECFDTFEWHSPIKCNDSKSITNESPCYVYDSQGRLRDLTPLIRSDGTSHKVDTSAFGNSVRDFYINVCNEAENKCGPLVTGCFTDTEERQNVEIGHVNSTEDLKWDSAGDYITLSYEGHFEPSVTGVDKRRKTNVRFICPKKHAPAQKPKLVQFNKTYSLVEWQTAYACPHESTKTHAVDCQINSLGVTVNLKDLSLNQDKVLVEGINISGTKHKMLIGICSGLKNDRCGPKSTAACLISETAGTQTPVGSVAEGTIRLEDTMVVLEYVGTEVCHSDSHYAEPKNKSMRFSKMISTRIEYSCDPRAEDIPTPTFVGFRDCTYIFSWPSKHLCREIALEHECEVKVNETYSVDLRALYRDGSEAPWKVTQASNHMVLGDIRLNVCGLLQHKDYEHECDYSSSICLVNPSQRAANATAASFNKTSTTTSSINLGIYDEAKFDTKTNKIKLLYTDGTPLNISDPKSPRRNTIVDLECGEDSNSTPKLVSTDIGLNLTQMTWKTPVACFTKTATPKSPKKPIVPQVKGDKVKPSTDRAQIHTTSTKSSLTLAPTTTAKSPSNTGSSEKIPFSAGHELHGETHREAEIITNKHSKALEDNHDTEQHVLPVKASQPIRVTVEPIDVIDERSHRFLMVSMIIFLFVSCSIVVFLIHNKTRIPRSLRELRMNREHSGEQFSYRRVLENPDL